MITDKMFHWYTLIFDDNGCQNLTTNNSPKSTLSSTSTSWPLLLVWSCRKSGSLVTFTGPWWHVRIPLRAISTEPSFSFPRVNQGAYDGGSVWIYNTLYILYMDGIVDSSFRNVCLWPLIEIKSASVGQMSKSPSGQLINNFYSLLEIWKNAKLCS